MTEKKKYIYIYIYRVHIDQTNSTVLFTHSPNKCHTIFTKHLFSIVVGHNFFFFLTYKELTPQ